MLGSAEISRHCSDAQDKGGSSLDAEERQVLIGSGPPPRVSTAAVEERQPVMGAAAAVGAMLAMAGYVLMGRSYTHGGPHSHGHGTNGFVLARQMVAAPIMLIAACYRHGCMLPTPEVRRVLVTLGALNFVNAATFVWGFTYTSPFITSVSQLLIPVFTWAYTRYYHLERPNLRKTLGIFFIALGCLVTCFGSHPTAGVGAMPHLWLGLLCLLVEVGSFVALMLIQKPVLELYPVPLVVGWSYSIGACFTLCYSFLDGSVGRLSGVFSSADGLLIVSYSAVVGAVFYFEAFAFATKHLPPTVVSASVALEPCAVSVLGALFFGTRVSATEVVGYLIAMAGATSVFSMVASEPSTVPASPPKSSHSASELDLNSMERMETTLERTRDGSYKLKQSPFAWSPSLEPDGADMGAVPLFRRGATL